MKSRQLFVFSLLFLLASGILLGLLALLHLSAALFALFRFGERAAHIVNQSHLLGRHVTVGVVKNQAISAFADREEHFGHGFCVRVDSLHLYREAGLFLGAYELHTK